MEYEGASRGRSCVCARARAPLAVFLCVRARRSVRSPRRCACAYARMRGDPRSPTRRASCCCCCCCCYYAFSRRRLVARRGCVAKIIAPVSRVSVPLSFCLSLSARRGSGRRTRCARTCRLSLSISLPRPRVIHSSLSFSFSLSLSRVLVPSRIQTHARSPHLSRSLSTLRTGTTFIPCVTEKRRTAVERRKT